MKGTSETLCPAFTPRASNVVDTYQWTSYSSSRSRGWVLHGDKIRRRVDPSSEVSDV